MDEQGERMLALAAARAEGQGAGWAVRTVPALPVLGMRFGLGPLELVE
ncbi:MAG TPA: hypothetical protein VE053_03015 [Allosphingosinicella sp.]|nr:hypothetical protein [Allosphingosinicella sp.]